MKIAWRSRFTAPWAKSTDGKARSHSPRGRSSVLRIQLLPVDEPAIQQEILVRGYFYAKFKICKTVFLLLNMHCYQMTIVPCPRIRNYLFVNPLAASRRTNDPTRQTGNEGKYMKQPINLFPSIYLTTIRQLGCRAPGRWISQVDVQAIIWRKKMVRTAWFSSPPKKFEIVKLIIYHHFQTQIII